MDPKQYKRCDTTEQHTSLADQRKEVTIEENKCHKYPVQYVHPSLSESALDRKTRQKTLEVAVMREREWAERGNMSQEAKEQERKRKQCRKEATIDKITIGIVLSMSTKV